MSSTYDRQDNVRREYENETRRINITKNTFSKIKYLTVAFCFIRYQSKGVICKTKAGQYKDTSVTFHLLGTYDPVTLSVHQSQVVCYSC